MESTRNGIGMVYQEFMIFPELTAVENIIMGFEKQRIRGVIDYRYSRQAVEEICKQYHFEIPLDNKVSELPVSILQQIEIVKVLYRGADILILDEPTSVLTPQGIEGLFDAIRFLKSKGVTVIIITHKLKEVFMIADAITVLKNGKVTGNVLPSEVDSNGLARLMVGRNVLLTVQKLEKKVGRTILSVKNLTVTDSSGVKRVDNVRLEVRAGEIIGIAGVAGSGQQQLIESIVGLLKPDKGSQILFEDRDMTVLPISERRRLGVGYVPQDRMREGVNPKGEIWENAVMGYHIAHGFGDRILRKRSVIRSFTDGIVSNYLVKRQKNSDVITSLSGGNIQKLIIGREFEQAQKLLIVEDPTRGVDVGAIEFVWKKIEEIASEGVAVLLISHELDEVMQLSDHIFVMYNGSLYEGGAYGENDDLKLGLIMTGEGEKL